MAAFGYIMQKTERFFKIVLNTYFLILFFYIFFTTFSLLKTFSDLHTITI